MTSIWTITTGRSGSRWLADTLDQLEGVTAIHEPEPRLFAANRAAAEGAVCDDLLRSMRPNVGEALYVETSPFTAHLVPAISRVFPGARFIHLHRCPRAFVSSALSLWFPPEDSWWPNTIPFEEPWQRMVWWWAEVNRIGLECPGDVFRVKSEDLWNGSSLGDLAEWVSKGSGVIGPAKRVNTGGAQLTWRVNWEPFLQEIAGPVMYALGRH